MWTIRLLQLLWELGRRQGPSGAIVVMWYNSAREPMSTPITWEGMMKGFVLILLLVLLAPPLAIAGKNAGGALIVHTTGIPGYRTFDVCIDYEDPGSCENAGTQLDDDFDSKIIWFLAAFIPGTDPGVSSITFGLDHNIPEGWMWLWGPCGPDGTIEGSDPGWPNDALTAGNRVLFGSPVVGVHLFPYYGMAIFGFPGAYTGTWIHPGAGYAGFQDDDVPAGIDRCFRFGQVRWFEPGFNQCPGPHHSPIRVPACCFLNGTCLYLDAEDCISIGGDPQGPGSTCDPNPCRTAAARNPHSLRTTWGRIKTDYRD
jgi:hypothetical protein